MTLKIVCYSHLNTNDSVTMGISVNDKGILFNAPRLFFHTYSFDSITHCSANELEGFFSQIGCNNPTVIHLENTKESVSILRNRCDVIGFFAIDDNGSLLRKELARFLDLEEHQIFECARKVYADSKVAFHSLSSQFMTPEDHGSRNFIYRLEEILSKRTQEKTESEEEERLSSVKIVMEDAVTGWGEWT